jgi:hypothetical protein
VAARIEVYLECGKKRTFAGALNWPGWCRYGRHETEALEALLEYGPKYASVLARTKLGFVAPNDLEQLVVVERLRGNATTDFGAIGIPPAVDRDRSCSAAEIKRFEKILRAGWRAFDKTVEAARGKRLAKGPRGGGRSLDAIVKHVQGADEGYLRAAGGQPPKNVKARERPPALRNAILETVRASASGELPERGPRGGVRWTARYYVRRVAWHVIAHAWEIERRAGS